MSHLKALDHGGPAARRLEGDALARAWYAVWSLALTRGEAPHASVSITRTAPATAIVVRTDGAEPRRHPLWSIDGAFNPWPDEQYSACSPAAPADCARQVEARAAEGFVAGMLWSTPGLLPERTLTALTIWDDGPTTHVGFVITWGAHDREHRDVLRDADGVLHAWETIEALDDWLIG